MPPNTAFLGAWGEDIARKYLEKKGYTFETANWHSKTGEIDIIMRKKDELVFVEVRLRSATTYGRGADTVAWQKQQKIIRTAQWYIQQTKQFNLPARFDVVSITHENGENPEIEHIEYAFGVN